MRIKGSPVFIQYGCKHLQIALKPKVCSLTSVTVSSQAKCAGIEPEQQEMCHSPNTYGRHCTYVSIWQTTVQYYTWLHQHHTTNVVFYERTSILLCGRDHHKSCCSIHWCLEKILRPGTVKDRPATCHSHHKGIDWQMYRQEVRWSNTLS